MCTYQLCHNELTSTQACKHILGDFQIPPHSQVPQHQGNLLLPLRAEHLQRLCHIPVARKKPLERPGITPSAHNFDKHVLARCYVG
jgi:hypothetical protein